MTAYLERPVETADQDKLERKDFVRRLGNALVSRDNSRATGVVVGITGEWGSGKSSILNLAAEHLRKDRGVILVKFDPWVISGRDDLIGRLLVQIAQELGHNDRGTIIARKLISYAEALGSLADTVVPGGSILVSQGANVAKKILAPPDLHARREGLKAALAEFKSPIIVLIDELDRLEDAEIRATAQFVRAVADFDRISYLLAYDHGRVTEALGADGGGTSEEKRFRGASYLEKIVQFQIPLPVAFRQELLTLADELLTPFAMEMDAPADWRSSGRCHELFDILVPGVLGTPRDIKRFAGMTHVQASMLGEVELIDLMGWCALMTKAPQVVEAIRRQPVLVGGPGLTRDQSVAYYDWQKRPVEERLSALGVASEDRNTPRLLSFLFPNHFGSHRSTLDRHPDCICNERPLLTLLRNGLPPGQFSRNDIRAFLTADSRSRQLILDDSMREETLAPFITRFGELYADFEYSDHVEVWRDIASFIEGYATPWPAEYTPFHHLGGNFLDSLTGGNDRLAPIAPGMRDATLALDATDDWHVLPEIINDHFWAYGLFGCRRQANRFKFLTAAETADYAQRMAERLVTGFLASSEAIGRLRSSIPLFAVSRMGRWTPQCRERLTDLLHSDPKLDSIVLLFFGGNHTVSQTSLDPLLDVATFNERVGDRTAGGLEGMPLSLAATYHKIAEWGIPAD